MPKPITIATATIAAGQSLSGVIDLTAGNPASIFFPAGWTGAILTVQGSYDGANFADLRAFGGDVMCDVVPGTVLALDSTLWAGVSHMKLRSGSSAAPIPQASDRVFKIAIIG